MRKKVTFCNICDRSPLELDAPIRSLMEAKAILASAIAGN